MVRGVSTAILTGLIGVGGTLLGLFAERWFQRLGKIRCTFGELFVNTYNTSGVEHKGGLPVDRNRPRHNVRHVWPDQW